MILVLGVLSGCRGATEVVLPPAMIVIASGDGQYGTVGSQLTESLHVVVTSISTGLPVKGANVLWDVEGGDATFTTIATVPTDSTGSARVGVRLGSTTGPVTVTARLEVQSSASVSFTLNAVDRPVLTSVTPGAAAPGASVVLTGLNFSPMPEQNIVLFSGIRGVVTAASSTSLSVTVPACLPQRVVDITTQLGAVASASVPLSVEAGGEVLTLAVGEVADASDPEGLACMTVAGSASYLAIVQSTGSLGAATYPWTLTSLADSPRAAVLPTAEPSVVGFREGLSETLDPVGDVEEVLRALEFEAVARARPRVEAPGAPARVPSVGERRTFQVFQSVGNFVEVTAEARFVGAHAAFFVDDDAPDGGYEDKDLEELSDQFDEFVYPTVSQAFGNESDLDASGRIVVLLTPRVNALTPRGSAGFVGGFFFGVDLFPEETGSNAAEVIYSLVPDPSGEFSDPRTKERLFEATPAILAHEFQHMVHFNERLLVLQAVVAESTWLSEGLAQYSEELVARFYDSQGDDDGVELFRAGARGRARRYLAGPDSVSIIISAGKGSLSERGGGFLFVMYLADRFGASIVEALTSTTRTGVANVETETGTEWGVLLSDWWAALWLDGTVAESDDRSYPTVDLRGFLEAPFPLVAEELGDGDGSRTGSMRSASAGYYIVTPDADGSTTLRLSGEAGGASLPQAGMKLRIIRIQ
jgi:hypothetical protein